MRSVATALLLSALATLAACAGPPPPMPVSTAAAPASFDGLYQGTVRQVASAGEAISGWCQTNDRAAIRVTNGQFGLSMAHPNVPGNPTIVFQVDVFPGGMFQNQSENGGAVITGQIGNGQLQAKVSGSGCQYSISAIKA